MKQAHVFYSGIVQGVGFRFTVQRFAQQSGLTGWVRNLQDGRVELLAEGEQTDIQDLLGRIEERFDGSISDRDIDYHPSSGQFRAFEITF